MTESRYVLENERLQNPPCEDLDEIFYHLSNDSKGLEAIENPLILKDLAQSRNNIDCVIYTFKFISEKEVFFDIMENNAEDFKNFDEKERKTISQMSKIFYNVLNNPPAVYDISNIKPGQRGTLIAYPYVDDNVSQNEKQKLYITWKNENSDIHIFEKMLKESELDSENFPNILRTSNSISIEEENGKIIVQFTGDSSYNINKYVYSPSLLKNAQEYIKSTLQRKEIFEDKDIEFRY